MRTVTDDKPRDPLQILTERLATASDVSSAASVLAWDRQTYMPEGGVGGRAQQLATLARLAHEMMVSEEVRELLEAAGHGEPGSEEAALLRITRRNHCRATKLPPRLVEESSYATALAEPGWLRAREGSDWSLFAPHLEKVLALKREQAHYLGDGDHPYDAMLDLYAPGSTTAGLRRMFDELKVGILPLVRGIGAGPGEDREAPLRGEFDEARQEEFARAVVSRFGYDWSRGRQDRAVHPFCINFGGPDDVRITTRVDRNLLPIASSPSATRLATASTSRAWTLPTRARRSRAASRWASTSPSRACGRTSSPAPVRSGPTSTLGCRARSPRP
jgi:carboxypeptidase Taq